MELKDISYNFKYKDIGIFLIAYQIIHFHQ